MGGMMPYVVKAVQEVATTTASLQAQISDLRGLVLSLNASRGASAISLTDLNQLAFTGGISVDGHVAFGSDTVGEATVLAHTVSTTIFFHAPYLFKPIISITPEDFITGKYKVGPVVSTSFDIILSDPQDHDVVFSWFAFEQKDMPISSETEETVTSSPAESSPQSVPDSGSPAPSSDAVVPSSTDSGQSVATSTEPSVSNSEISSSTVSTPPESAPLPVVAAPAPDATPPADPVPPAETVTPIEPAPVDVSSP
jgi:hypothetical protein